jgi:hemoglobin-like flavoprotein
MNPQQIAAVRNTFALLVPQADHVARLFYARLFELDPQLRPLFKADMTEQRGKLMSMLAAGVSGLDRLDTLGPVLQQLGARHATYGVRDAHYGSVGAALLDTLARGLGDTFTADTRDAWAEAYTLIAGTMQAGTAVAPSFC